MWSQGNEMKVDHFTSTQTKLWSTTYFIKILDFPTNEGTKGYFDILLLVWNVEWITT